MFAVSSISRCAKNFAWSQKFNYICFRYQNTKWNKIIINSHIGSMRPVAWPANRGPGKTNQLKIYLIVVFSITRCASPFALAQKLHDILFRYQNKKLNKMVINSHNESMKPVAWLANRGPGKTNLLKIYLFAVFCISRCA